MKITCPSCGTALKFTRSAQQKFGRCPRCQNRFALDEAIEKAEAQSQPAFSLSPGRTFAGFRIERPLGAGGMAEVYLATQLSLGRPVAVKLLPEFLTQNPRALSRFDREARALAALRHPNIVSVIDRGRTEDGLNYIVMDAIEGPDLRRAIADGTLTASDIIRIMLALCDGLQHAHDNGIVHRDLKPGNVLLDGAGTPHIADFGIARLRQGTGATTAVTADNAIMGTHGYMAPEQIGTAKDADHRADIYALGVVLYEMMTGQLPLGTWQAPSACRPDFPYNFDEVVHRSLRTDPLERYQDASEFADAVRKAIARSTEPGALPIRQIGQTPPRRAPSKHWKPWLTGGAVALAIIVVLLVLAWRRDDDPSVGNEAPHLTPETSASGQADVADDDPGALTRSYDVSALLVVLSKQKESVNLLGLMRDHIDAPQDMTERPIISDGKLIVTGPPSVQEEAAAFLKAVWDQYGWSVRLVFSFAEAGGREMEVEGLSGVEVTRQLGAAPRRFTRDAGAPSAQPRARPILAIPPEIAKDRKTVATRLRLEIPEGRVRDGAGATRPPPAAIECTVIVPVGGSASLADTALRNVPGIGAGTLSVTIHRIEKRPPAET